MRNKTRSSTCDGIDYVVHVLNSDDQIIASASAKSRRVAFQQAFHLAYDLAEAETLVIRDCAQQPRDDLFQRPHDVVIFSSPASDVDVAVIREEEERLLDAKFAGGARRPSRR